MRYKQTSIPHIHDVCPAKVTETGMKLRKRLSGLKDACGAWLRSRLSTTRPKSDARASILDMSGPKLIVQPDDGEKPVVDFLHSAQKTLPSSSSLSRIRYSWTRSWPSIKRASGC